MKDTLKAVKQNEDVWLIQPRTSPRFVGTSMQGSVIFTSWAANQTQPSRCDQRDFRPVKYNHLFLYKSKLRLM